LHSLALASGGGAPVKGAAPELTLDALRHVSAAHGTNLSEERLRVVRPVLERHFARLRALREFELDDNVAPTQGILDR
jgi:hypothetical protein